jgi:hypothetical protein
MQHKQKTGMYYGTMMGKAEGKGLLGSPRYGCVDNIKMYLGEIEWGGSN